MFLSSLNLALLSFCYFGSNNSIVPIPSQVISQSFNDNYGVYDLYYSLEDPHVNYVLRYDNVSLLKFSHSFENDGADIYFSIEGYSTLNFSVYFDYDTNISLGNYTGSFDCIYNPSNPYYYNFEFHDVTDYEDYSPTLRLSIRLLSEVTYNSLTDGLNYSQGYNDGYTDAMNNQVPIAYDNGYGVGYQDGFNTGQSSGYESGFHSGSESGYARGFNDALEGHDFSFTNLFASISDTPILIIRRLFGFELFGVSLISVFMSLLTALIVIHLIKKVF